MFRCSPAAPDADAADYTRTAKAGFCRSRWPLGVGRPIRASQSTTALDEDVVMAAPASVHADRDPMIVSILVNSSLVNCAPDQY